MPEITEIKNSSLNDTRSNARWLVLLGLALAVGIVVGVTGTQLFHSCEDTMSENHHPDQNKDGFVMKDVNMNDLMSWLAKLDKMQYFHNAALDDSKYKVNGHLKDVSDPKLRINDIALHFELRTQIKNDTLYVLTPNQYEKWNIHSPK